MAVRTISTKLAVEGEAEYRASISKVNSELKTLGSELKLVESNFKGEANSMAALTAKGAALQGVYDKQAQKVKEVSAALTNAKNAQQAYTERIEATKAKIAANDAAMDKLKASTTDTSEAQAKLAANTEKLKRELEEATVKEEASGRAINDWQRQVNNAQIELNNLNGEIKQNDRYLDEAKSSADKCATSIDKYGKEVKQTATETENATEKTGLLSKIFAGGFLANIATQALSAVVSKLKQLVTAAFSTADELEKLSSVTGFTTSELQKMSYIGDDLGVSLETQSSALKKLINNMSSAQSGSGTAYEAFKKLKVEYEDGNKKLLNSNEVYGKVIDALGKMTNETERNAAAQDIFGKSATELNPLVEAGSKALQELGNQAEATGAIMSEDAVDALDATGDALDHVKQRAEAFVGETLAGLISSGKSAAETMGDLADELGAQNNIGSLIEKYRKLSAEVSDSSTNSAHLSAKTEELNQVKQELIAASSGVVTALDIENGSFDDQLTVLENLTTTERKYNEYKLKAAILSNSGVEAAKKEAEVQERLVTYETRRAEAQKRLESAQSAQMEGKTRTWYGASYDSIIKDNEKLIEYLEGAKGKANESLASISEEAVNAEASLRALVEGGYMTAAEAAIEFADSGIDVNAIIAGIGEASDAAIPAIADLETAMSSIQEKYNEAYQAAYTSLDGQISKWQEMDNTAVTSAANVLAALQSQIDWIAQYDANLSALESRTIPGVDTSELVQSLSDGSAESAAILAGLAAATDAEVAQIVASMGKVETGKENLSGTMAEAATDFSGKMDEMSQKVDEAVAGMNESVEAGKAARDTMNGYISKARSMIPTLESTFAEAGRRANQAYRDAQESRSPSKKAMKATADYFDGLINQAESMTPDLEATFSKAAGAANQAALTAMPSDFRVSSEISKSQTVNHEGKIVVEGVNTQGQLVGVTEILLEDLKKAVRM